GRRLGCTAFMTLFGAYALLLHRLYGQDDVTVGVPVSIRSGRDAERLVGYCTNMLPIRCRYAATDALPEFLKATRQRLIAGFEHAHFPFAAIVRAVNPPRSPGRQPLVSVSFNLERQVNLPPIDDLVLAPLTPPVTFAKLDLHLNASQVDGTLRLDLDYDATLFDADAAERILAAYKALLEGMVAAPDSA